jgi:hypothetical protein
VNELVVPRPLERQPHIHVNSLKMINADWTLTCVSKEYRMYRRRDPLRAADSLSWTTLALSPEKGWMLLSEYDVASSWTESCHQSPRRRSWEARMLHLVEGEL